MFYSKTLIVIFPHFTFSPCNTAFLTSQPRDHKAIWLLYNKSLHAIIFLNCISLEHITNNFFLQIKTKSLDYTNVSFNLNHHPPGPDSGWQSTGKILPKCITASGSVPCSGAQTRLARRHKANLTGVEFWEAGGFKVPQTFARPK